MHKCQILSKKKIWKALLGMVPQQGIKHHYLNTQIHISKYGCSIICIQKRSQVSWLLADFKKCYKKKKQYQGGNKHGRRTNNSRCQVFATHIPVKDAVSCCIHLKSPPHPLFSASLIIDCLSWWCNSLILKNFQCMNSHQVRWLEGQVPANNISCHLDAHQHYVENQRMWLIIPQSQ